MSELGSAPLVTIATVCRNPGAALRATAQSVATLKRPWMRYLVVDGASDDGTAELLRAGLPGVDGFVTERDSGIYCAMNKAVAMTQPGSYLLFLGAGDRLTWTPAKEDFEGWRRDGIRFVFGDAEIGGRSFRSVFNRKIFYRNTIHHQGLFVLKRGHEDVGWFDERYRVFADWDSNLVAYLEGVRSVALSRVVASAEPGGVSGSAGHYLETFHLVRRRLGVARAIFSVGYHVACRLGRS